MNSENPTPKTDKQVIDNFRRGGRMIEKREWISDRELQAFLKGNLPIDPQGVVFQLAMKQLSGQTVTPNEQQYLKLSPSSVHHQYEQALTQYGGKQLSLLPKLNYIDELTGELLKRQGYSPVNTAQLTLAIAAKHSNGGRLTESERGFLQTVERHNQQKFTYVTDVAVDDLLKPEPFAMAQEPATPFPKTALLP
ncbi:MAG: hypothetical protein LH609_12260, partial [Rudanella sp.]|nr:hypothetical protein [Rudanella sp.]